MQTMQTSELTGKALDLGGDVMLCCTEIQRLVVESRLAQGYEHLCNKPNGNVEIVKGRHRMEINGVGHDVYVPTYLGLP